MIEQYVKDAKVKTTKSDPETLRKRNIPKIVFALEQIPLIITEQIDKLIYENASKANYFNNANIILGFKLATSDELDLREAVNGLFELDNMYSESLKLGYLIGKENNNE